MHILIAPNAFKNSLGAAEAAGAISEGLQQSKLSCTTFCFPVGDGGDGTAALIIQHCNGTTVPVTVQDPLGRKISSSFGLMDNGKTAVIEMADASGLRLLQSNELDVLHTNSYGTGELIVHALDKKVNKIILCIGGSATVDGGAGILRALGFRFLNKNGKELNNMPEDLTELDSIDVSGVDKRIMDRELVILCDVENVLLGKKGAAAVFGPQKGASPAEVKKLEASLSKLRDIVLKQTGIDMSAIKHGGAAGGTAAGLAALLHAQLVNGIDHFLSLTGFDTALAKADLIITGEGSIDEQTLQGKGPFGVAKRAKQNHLPVIGLAGKLPLEISTDLQEYFDILLPINNELMDIAEALQNTKPNLTRTARTIGDMLAVAK
ncbi:MAG: glycerate kinase [Bacteroidota bacterium]